MSLLVFVVSPGPLTPTAVLTYDNVILKPTRMCSVFLSTCGVRVLQIGKGWDSGYISLAALSI